MSSSNNKKSYTGASKRYTTRQIMELTEKRRKQMDEEARQKALAHEGSAAQNAAQASQTEKRVSSSHVQEAAVPMPAQAEAPSMREHQKPLSVPSSEDGSLRAFHEAIEQFTQQVREHPARFEFPEETSSPFKEGISAEDGTSKQQMPDERAVNGKSVASVFREQPRTTAEHAVSDLIEREVDKVLNSVSSVDKSVPRVISKSGLDGSVQGSRYQVLEQGTDGQRRGPKQILPVAMEWALTMAASVLLAFMFAHAVFSGWEKYYYDQSPFVLLMALSALWLNRGHLEKRTQWFWGSTVIIAGGLGVFLAATIEGRPHIELAGFITVCFGIFMWRYTEESASRLFFPLVSLLFMIAPPELWEKMMMPRLNNAVFSFSADILNSFHLPALFEESRFYVGPGVIDSWGDTMVFRSIVAFMPLAALCVAFQNMARSWSIALFLSIFFWGILGGILRITVTGVMLDSFGVEYASMFYEEYSAVIVLVVMVAGLTLTAGLLPHREEE